MDDKHKPRGQDRRRADKGAPSGWKDRRRNPDRRMPEVEEVSLDEFEALLAQTGGSSTQGGSQYDHGWDKLGKID